MFAVAESRAAYVPVRTTSVTTFAVPSAPTWRVHAATKPPLSKPSENTVCCVCHVRVAGDASRLPAASAARTASTWVPGEREVTVCGEAHEAYAPPSNRHSNVPPVSVETNANVAWAPATVPLGPEVIVVSGAAVSTASCA